MAKGNVGQGQYRAPTSPRANAGLTGSSIKPPAGDGGFMDSIKTMTGSFGGDQNYTMNPGNTGYSGMMSGGGYNQFGPSLMMGNPYNNFGGGWVNPFMSMFNPNAPTGRNAPAATPNTPAAPTASRTFNQNEANVQLRQGLNRDLTPDEMNRIRGVIGNKDNYTQEDIERARTLIRQNQPGLFTPPTAPVPGNRIDPGGVGIPNTTPQARGMSAQDALGALGLKGALTGEQQQMLLSQFGGKTEFDQGDIARARGLVGQYLPHLL